MRSGAEESAAHRRQELLRPAEFRPPGPAHLVGTLLRRPPGGTIRLIRRTPKRRATANPRSRPPRTGSTKRVRYIKDHSATAMAPTASPRSLDTETAAIGHRASRRPRPADVRSGSDRTYTESLLPPARLRCAGVGLASADVERSRGIVQPRASAAGVGRPAAACRVVRMPLRTTEAGDRSSLHRHVASPGRLDGRRERHFWKIGPDRIAGSSRRVRADRTVASRFGQWSDDKRGHPHHRRPTSCPQRSPPSTYIMDMMRSTTLSRARVLYPETVLRSSSRRASRLTSPSFAGR